MKIWPALVYLCAGMILITGFLLGSLAIFCLEQYESERTVLRSKAESITQNVRTNKALSLANLNEWVYYNKGFRKNPYFLWLPALGPTPLQIMEHGGDCADKSRLLSAMLHEIGIDNTLVMLYSNKDLQPSHTIVETREQGFMAAADPVFNIVFPDGNGHLLGIKELRASGNLLKNRLNYLSQYRAPGDKINFYPLETETYDFPRTINWDKNLFTNLLGQAMDFWVEDAYLVTRPRILENPYLLVSAVALCFAIVFLDIGFATFFMLRMERHRHGFPAKPQTRLSISGP